MFEYSTNGLYLSSGVFCWGGTLLIIEKVAEALNMSVGNSAKVVSHWGGDR